MFVKKFYYFIVFIPSNAEQRLDTQDIVHSVSTWEIELSLGHAGMC